MHLQNIASSSYSSFPSSAGALSTSSRFNLVAQLISIDAITPSRYQPRKSFDSTSLLRLADSIRRYGVLQPITVRHSDLSTAAIPKYEIICGERRYRASVVAGLSYIPCIIVTSDDMSSAELSIIENLLRDDLTMFEQAEAFNLLITTFKLTQEEVASRISLSQSAIANKLRLLRFTPAERNHIISSGLTERHARSLLRISDLDTRMRFIKIISKDKLNVASTEALIDNYLEYLSSHGGTDDISKHDKNHVARHSTGIVKDLRILTNTIEKAAGTLRNAGILVETSSTEHDQHFDYNIRVYKKKPQDI